MKARCGHMLFLDSKKIEGRDKVHRELPAFESAFFGAARRILLRMEMLLNAFIGKES
jgi:hypothetical protein